MRKKIFQPKLSSPRAAEHFTGDFVTSDSAPEARVLPEFGDVLLPENLTGDTLDRFSGFTSSVGGYGDLPGFIHGASNDEVGDLSIPGKGLIYKKGSPAAAVGAGAVKPLPANSLQAVGRSIARQVLTSAGIPQRGQQDGLIDTAMTAVQMGQLGRQAMGLLSDNNNVPFISLQLGKIIALRNFRENAGFKARLLRHFANEMLVRLPYKTITVSGTPAVGGNVDLINGSGVTADTDYPIFAIAVKIGSNLFQRNDAKVFSVTLQTSVGAGASTTIYTVDCQYQEDGNIYMIFIPAKEVDGNYYPQILTARNDTVAANDLHVQIQINGNDGVNDVVTAVALGYDSMYMNNLMARLDN